MAGIGAHLLPEESDTEKLFLVENIRQKRIINGKTFYLIKWEGYQESHNSWEPVENLGSCHELIKTFNQKAKNNNLKNANSKKKRESNRKIVSKGEDSREKIDHNYVKSSKSTEVSQKTLKGSVEKTSVDKAESSGISSEKSHFQEDKVIDGVIKVVIASGGSCKATQSELGASPEEVVENVTAADLSKKPVTCSEATKSEQGANVKKALKRKVESSTLVKAGPDQYSKKTVTGNYWNVVYKPKSSTKDASQKKSKVSVKNKTSEDTVKSTKLDKTKSVEEDSYERGTTSVKRSLGDEVESRSSKNFHFKGFKDGSNVVEKKLDCKMKFGALKMIDLMSKSSRERKNSVHQNVIRRVPNGFARGLRPRRIIGAKRDRVTGELEHVVQWIGVRGTEFIPADESRLKCPQLVLDFYESRLLFKP